MNDAWEDAGQQLVAEEQQAQAKAAAKRAKKQKQKVKKQLTQQALHEDTEPQPQLSLEEPEAALVSSLHDEPSETPGLLLKQALPTAAAPQLDNMATAQYTSENDFGALSSATNSEKTSAQKKPPFSALNQQSLLHNLCSCPITKVTASGHARV